MANHPKTERTLVIIKPDGLQRTLVGEIIRRYERLGLKLVGMKLMVPTAAHVEKHYNLDPNWKRIVARSLLKRTRRKV